MPEDAPHPVRISLVVPVFNEAGSLRALIEGIRAQTFPPAEVIIVDGGSTDGSGALVRSLIADDPRFRVIETSFGTPGRNRNLGAEASSGEWIAFTDAGTRAEPDWLERLAAQAARDPEAAVVYGNYEPVEDSFFARASALAYLAPKVERDGGRMRGPSVVSMMLRRRVWADIGGFPDLRAAEDLLFMEAVERQGFRIAWAPRATIWWQLQPDFGSTFRRFALYSYHNALIGRVWDWHHGIARHYAAVALLVLLAVLHSPWWWPGIPLWLGARAGLAMWRRRRGLLPTLNPVLFLTVAAILVTIDMATFTGWVRALGRKRS